VTKICDSKFLKTEISSILSINTPGFLWHVSYGTYLEKIFIYFTYNAIVCVRQNVCATPSLPNLATPSLLFFSEVAIRVVIFSFQNQMQYTKHLL
jgi:hypothetical protein